MPRIREYTQQTSAQGAIDTRRATEADFGFSQQMQQFGGTMQEVGAYIKQEEDRREIENATLGMAQARQQWTETYISRQQNMRPGDMSMAPAMRKEMEDYFGGMSDNYKSDKAKNYVRMNGMSLTTDFFVRGLQHQQQQAGIKAVSDHENRVATDAKTLAAVPDMYNSVAASLKYDITNGVGSYEFLKNSPRKDEFMREAIEKLAWSAAMTASENPMMRAMFMHLLPKDQMDEAQLGGKIAEMEKKGASDIEIATFIKMNRPNAAVQIGEATYAQDEKLKDEPLPQWFKDLSFDKRAAFMKSVSANQHRDDAVAMQALRQKVADDDAYIRLYGQRPEKTLNAGDFKDNVIGWETYSAMLKAADTMTVATKLPIDQGISMIEALKPKEGDAALAQKAKEYDEAARLFAGRWKEIQSDPIKAAMNSRFSAGQSPIVPLSVSSPEKWADELSVRIPQSKAVESAWGLRGSAPAILSKPEAEAMGKVFDQMSIDKQFEAIGTLTTRFKDDPSAVVGLFNQIAPNNSSINAAAYYATKRSDAIQGGETRDNVVGHILAGMKAMKPLDKGKGLDTEKAVQRAGMPSATEALKLLSGMSGYSDGVSPEFQIGLEKQIEVVMAHYVGKQISSGRFNLNLREGDNKSAFEKSVESVLGKPVHFGSTRVLKPWGMKEDEFIRGIENRVNAAVGKPVSGYGLMQEAGVAGDVYRVLEGGIATNILINMANEIPPKPTRQLHIGKIR